MVCLYPCQSGWPGSCCLATPFRHAVNSFNSSHSASLASSSCWVRRCRLSFVDSASSLAVTCSLLNLIARSLCVTCSASYSSLVLICWSSAATLLRIYILRIALRRTSAAAPPAGPTRRCAHGSNDQLVAAGFRQLGCSSPQRSGGVFPSLWLLRADNGGFFFAISCLQHTAHDTNVLYFFCSPVSGLFFNSALVLQTFDDFQNPIL